MVNLWKESKGQVFETAFVRKKRNFKNVLYSNAVIDNIG